MTNDDSSYEFYPKEITETGTFKVMLDWQCSPIWYKVDEADIFEPIEVEDMPISEELKQAFINWNNAFQPWLNMAEPYDSGLSNPNADELFRRIIDLEGETLYYALKKELFGKYDVCYHGWFYGKRLIP